MSTKAKYSHTLSPRIPFLGVCPMKCLLVHTHTHTKEVHQSDIHSKWENPKFSSPVELSDECYYIHAMEDYMVMITNTWLTAIVWMNFKSIILPERSQEQNNTFYMISIYTKFKNKQN